MLHHFRLVLEGETAKEIPESSRFEFLEKFLGNNFALSEAVHINSNLNPFTKFTSSSRSAFKDIISWNISQMIKKTIPVSTRIVISYAMNWGIPF